MPGIGRRLKEYEVTGLQLMERAGRGVVKAIFDEWPELDEDAHHAVILVRQLAGDAPAGQLAAAQQAASASG